MTIAPNGLRYRIDYKSGLTDDNRTYLEWWTTAETDMPKDGTVVVPPGIRLRQRIDFPRILSYEELGAMKAEILRTERQSITSAMADAGMRMGADMPPVESLPDLLPRQREIIAGLKAEAQAYEVEKKRQKAALEEAAKARAAEDAKPLTAEEIAEGLALHNLVREDCLDETTERLVWLAGRALPQLESGHQQVRFLATRLAQAEQCLTPAGATAYAQSYRNGPATEVTARRAEELMAWALEDRQ